MDWLPIKTAPRDGSQFLAYDSVADEFDVCVMSDRMGWRCSSCQSDGEYGQSSDEFNDDRATLWAPIEKPRGV